MPIDFNKYGGTSTSEKKKKKESGIGVDFSKYQPQEPMISARPVRPTRIMETPSFDITQSPLMKTIQAQPVTPPTPTYLESLKSLVPTKEQLSSVFNIPTAQKAASTILSTLGRPSQVIAEYATPNAPLIGELPGGGYGEIPGTNARQAFLERTGQRPATGFGEKALGMVAAPFAVPGAGLGTGTALTKATGESLARLSPKFAQTLGGRIAQGAAVGAPIGAGTELATGTGKAEDVAISGGLGAGLGAAFPLVGAGLGTAAKAIGGKIGSALERFRSSRAASPINQQAEESIQSIISQPSRNIPSRLQPLSGTQTLDRVMSQIKPIVTERMTPPLENPNELAKWVRSHLGSDISLNEVRKVPYEDLRQLAEEIKGNINVYDTAVQAAKRRGFDLPTLLEGKVHSIGTTVTRQAQERVAGIYPSELPKVQRPQLPPLRETNPDIPRDVFPEQVLPAEGVKQTWFQRLFGNQVLGITPGSIQRGRNPFTTEGQIVSKPLKQTTQGVIETTKAAGRRAYQEMVDMNEPIKKISREAYDTSMDASRSNQIANVIIGDKFVNPEGVVIGEGLKGIVRKSGRGNYNAFTDYLIARHALTRMNRGERVYAEALEMTPQKIQDRLNLLESRYPGFKELGTEWDGYFKNIRQTYGVNEGLLSKELADVLEQKNPNYSPMQRQFTTEEKIKGIKYSGAKPMFSGQKAPIQEVSPTGSTRKVVDPVRTTIEQTGAWVNAAMRNRTMQSIVKKVTENPEAMKNIVEIVQPPKGQMDLREIIKVEGEDRFLEMLQDDFNKLFKSQRLDEDNIVRAMVQGEPVYLKVKDPEAVKALVGMGAENSNIVLDIANQLSKATKFGATGALAPMFAIKSSTMDLAQAIIQSKNPLRHAGDFLGAIISSIANELKIPGLRNIAQDFYRTGGGYSAALRGERGLKKGVGEMKRGPLLSAPSLAKGTFKAVTAPVKALYKISDISENLNRMAAYTSELRRLGGERTPENIRQAMNASREITTNYSRRGLQGRTIESFIPYNNAAVQGMYRFARAWKKNPIKTTALVGATVLVPKFYEYARFNDDPDYQNIPARERYRNLIVNKNKDGTFTKIPMSPEYNGIGALFVDMLAYYKDGDPEAFKGVADALVNAYTPPAVSGALQGITQGGGIEKSLSGLVSSTVASPVSSVMSNRDYAGRPIESGELEDLSPAQRYNERTSEVAKTIGQKLNYSPQKVDYLLRAYGGDPARLLLPLTSEVGAGTPRNTLLKNFITDPTITNNLSTDYYDMKKKIDQTYRDYKEKNVELPPWYSDGLRKYVSSTGSIGKQLTYFRDYKTQLQTDKSLSAEEKTEQIRGVQAKMNEIYLDVNSRMKEAGVPMVNR